MSTESSHLRAWAASFAVFAFYAIMLIYPVTLIPGIWLVYACDHRSRVVCDLVPAIYLTVLAASFVGCAYLAFFRFRLSPKQAFVWCGAWLAVCFASLTMTALLIRFFP